MKKQNIVIFIIFLILSPILCKANQDDFKRKKYLKKKIQSINLRFALFTEAEKVEFSKKLIKRLRNHFYPGGEEALWINDGEIFARILK